MDKQKTKIGILLFSHEDSDEYQRALRFAEEIKKIKYTPEILFSDLFSVFFKKNKLEIYYNTKPLDLKNYKLIIPRYSLCNGDSYDRFSIARFLKQAGIKIINSPESAFLAKNKRDSLIKLALGGLSVIPTGINYSQFFLDEQLKRNKSNRIVVKGNLGSLGYNVSVLDSHISFISFMEFTGGLIDPSNILIQPFINSKSSDYRLIVIDNKVIVAMKRQARGIEFRSNISKGGEGSKINPTKKMTDMAIKASKMLGLDYAGVDIMKDEKGKLYIVEVNCNPSLAIEEIAGANIVKKIVKYGIRKS